MLRILRLGKTQGQELRSLWAGRDLCLPQAPEEGISLLLEAGRAKARTWY